MGELPPKLERATRTGRYGAILDVIHEIDYIRWLLGEVAGTTCVAGKLSQLEIDTEDVAEILLRFENGAVGEIHLD